jgi:hypothetical protein
MAAGVIDVGIAAFNSSGASRGVVYLSTPIESGRRELEAAAARELSSRSEFRRQYPDVWRREVIEPNKRRASDVAQTLSTLYAGSRLVVNPAAFEVAGWSKSRYDQLWASLLHGFGHAVVPLEGWAYSRGARLEVRLALELGLEVLTEEGQLTTRGAVLREAQAALEECRQSYSQIVDIELPAI